MKTTFISVIIGVATLLCGLILSAQTFHGSGGNIPDDGNSIEFTIQVQNLQPPYINTTTFGLESVCINISHPWVSNLDISLIAPDGTKVLLTTGLGGDGDNYAVTCFNSNALNSIISGYAPFNGTYKPIGSLGLVNNFQNANGSWRLRILDTYAFADAGSLNNWNITFGNHPSPVFRPDSSELPIVIINSNGQHIPDEPKITAHMGIVDNGPGQINHRTDPFNAYNGFIGIELRGSSSQMFPKKPYGFETRDSSGNNLNVALLGMPSENDWMLIPNYTDKTLMRNSLTCDLARNMGYWAPRSRFCEVFVNNEYMGVYALMEKIKRDNDRVNITPLTPSDNSGDALTGGYMVKIDKMTGQGNDGWTSAFPPPVNNNGQTIFFQYHYPDAQEITPQQKNYIQAYIDTFETVLSGSQFNHPVNGYYKYADLNSFVDYFIINELGKNVDGYRLSTFLYKNRNSEGGKLVMGPVWDYDLAYRNANYCGGDDHTGWAYEFGNQCGGDSWQLPFWWDKLLTDTLFKNTLNCRWNALRTTLLDTTALFNYIDSVHSLINNAQTRNFQQWPILGLYIWPNPQPIPTSYIGEIQALKKWFRNRLTWLDANMPGHCWNTAIHSLTPPPDVIVFPNPAHNHITIQCPPTLHPQSYEVLDMLGRTLLQGTWPQGENLLQININNLSSNSYYYVRILSEKGIWGRVFGVNRE